LPKLAEEDNIWSHVLGFEESLAFLEQAWATGNFHGLLGFSQGGLTSAMFCAYLRDVRVDLPQPRFIVLCGGFMRPWPASAQAWWPPCPLLSTPSLHVIGDKDTIVAPCRSEELRDVFADPIEHRHGLVGHPSGHGGHVLPWPGDTGDDSFFEKLAAFIRRSCGIPSQTG